MPTSLILLIDDEPLVRLYLRRVLQRVCPTSVVLMADSVNEAHQILQANAITAILSDYHLSDGTALDVLHIALPAAPRRPVVVTSTDTTVAGTVLAAGATAFVSKLAALPDLEVAFAVLC